MYQRIYNQTIKTFGMPEWWDLTKNERQIIIDAVIEKALPERIFQIQAELISKYTLK